MNEWMNTSPLNNHFCMLHCTLRTSRSRHCMVFFRCFSIVYSEHSQWRPPLNTVRFFFMFGISLCVHLPFSYWMCSKQHSRFKHIIRDVECVFLCVLHVSCWQYRLFRLLRESAHAGSFVFFSTALLPLIALIEPQCGLITSTFRPNLFIYLFVVVHI